MTSFIEVQNAEMVFTTRKGRFHALREINLQIERGEFITLIGHSGCGKSTLLNLIAGLLTPSSGVLLCDNREIAAPGPERAVVFQNHSLLPWLTCYENVHLGVERVFGASESKEQLKERTQAALALVGMSHAIAKRPHEISGGMKQRVGIARAFAMEPKILLMDEPFAALDEQTRLLLGDKVLQIQEELKQTTMLITHNITEAVQLSDRIMVMTYRPGKVKRIVDIDLPRPRTSEIVGSDDFGHYVAQIWTDLREEASRGLTEDEGRRVTRATR